MVKKGSRLKRNLGILEVFSISSGAMISSGLFILPAVVYSRTGPSILIAYFLASLFVIPAMFSKTELATAMPKSGGIYFFVYRSLGPLLGTFAGFASWFSLGLKSAFALLGIGIFLQLIFPSFPADMVKLIAIGFTILFTVLNIFSVKESGKFQIIIVFLLITILILYFITGINHINIYRYVPFITGGWKSILSVTGMIFISFGGLTKIASVAEEIKYPKKIIPAGMFSAFVVVSILYLGVIFITIGLLEKNEFINTLTPISLAASTYSGSIGFIVLAAAAILAFISTANAGLLASSRSPLAMSKDNLLPSIIGRVNIRYKTPVMSILLTSAFMIICIIFLDLENLVKVASTMKLLLFAFVNLAVIIMRESKIVSYRPSFKSPFYPYIQIAGIVIYIFLIIDMGKLPLIITAFFFILSLIWYLLYSKSRSTKDSALIHIVERITSKEIKSNTLAEELKDILIERDEIVEDRFDKIIKEASIIEIEKEMNSRELFQLISSQFAQKFNIDRKEIYDLLEKREEDSTTVIHKGLAIPHIIIAGESKFDIIVIRSKTGIIFKQDSPPVHIVFALAGSKNERNFHLQALMAIAQIVQSSDFPGAWMKAETVKELKNLILLSDRIRKGEI